MAKQNSVDRIADALVRHQIRLIRLAMGSGRNLTKILDRTEAQLQRALEDRIDRAIRPRATFGKTTRETIRRIMKVLERIQKPTWTKIEFELRKELLKVAKAEIGFITVTTEQSLPVVVGLTALNVATLNQLTFTQPIEGKTVNRWTKTIRANDRARFLDAIQNGLVQGQSGAQISRALFGTVRQRRTDGQREITRRHLTTLAQTTINAVTNRARSEWYSKNKDVFDEEIFVATLDARTTPQCRAYDGKRFPLNKGPKPPLHFNCRSLRVPALNYLELAKRPASGVSEKLLEGLKGPERRRVVQQLTGQVPASTTYQTFLKRQTKGFQEEVLGKTKAKLFRDGKLELDKFINPQGKELTLAQLRRAHPEAFQRAGL